MRTMRARHAALVAQIDHEVGCILETLRARGSMEATLIVVSSDHGDYLGDHGMAGKGSFCEAATHVPMLVRTPHVCESSEHTGLVELADVTATILGHAGCRAPGYMTPCPCQRQG